MTKHKTHKGACSDPRMHNALQLAPQQQQNAPQEGGTARGPLVALATTRGLAAACLLVTAGRLLAAASLLAAP